MKDKPPVKWTTNVTFFNAMDYSNLEYFMGLKKVTFVIPLTSEANLRFAKSRNGHQG